MDISPTIRERINAAADTLYEQAGRQGFPTVDAVRKLAKVNMNDASNGMREWRRAHVIQDNSTAAQVPVKLQETSANALNVLWAEAMTLANETFRTAQVGWDAERAEIELLNQQLAGAFDALATELTSAQSEIAILKQEIGVLNNVHDDDQRCIEEARNEAREARIAASQAEARALEIGRRADDLHQALDQAHLGYKAASTATSSRLQLLDREITKLRTELAEARMKYEQKETTAHAELLLAKEEAALLRGKLSATNST